MPDTRPTPAGDRTGSERSAGAAGANDAWSALSLIISGVLLWGLVGAGVGHLLEASWPLPVGLVLGMTGGLYLVWFRYGRS